MVAAGFLALGCSAGQIANCYNLLIVPICEDLDVARSAMGLSQSLQSIGGILISVFAGPIFFAFPAQEADAPRRRADAGGLFQLESCAEYLACLFLNCSPLVIQYTILPN